MELTIDTASDMASLALSQEGALVAELTWHCPRNHSVELLPTLQQLMQRADIDKGDLTAIFVSIGPGSYTGLRVGVSTAKGLAFALRLPLVGVGRLEAEAYQHADYRGHICAIHRAGRGELAWAVYTRDASGWREVTPPRLSMPDHLIATARRRLRSALFCGEISDELAQRLREALGQPTVVAEARGMSVRRAGFTAELAWRRLASGQADDAASLKPIYLREAVTRPPKGGRK
ncbi:MAG: tRNA (adenosine(37)-N6)-threonylcarbamoyltransferase complex dimerization subunit type 1 TsaB [Dehalococcoidia bacterium]